MFKKFNIIDPQLFPGWDYETIKSSYIVGEHNEWCRDLGSPEVYVPDESTYRKYVKFDVVEALSNLARKTNGLVFIHPTSILIEDNREPIKVLVRYNPDVVSNYIKKNIEEFKEYLQYMKECCLYKLPNLKKLPRQVLRIKKHPKGLDLVFGFLLTRPDWFDKEDYIEDLEHNAAFDCCLCEVDKAA